MVVTVRQPTIRPGRNLLAVRASDAFALETYLNVSVTLKDSSGCSSAIYTINGVPPTDEGYFTLDGAAGVYVTNGTNKVTFESIIAADNICYRTGDPGNPGPDGPDGPAGRAGKTPAARCCSCNTCEKCNTCEICNECEGFFICGAADTTKRVPGCHTLLDGATEITGSPVEDLGAAFGLIVPYDEDPC